MDVTTFLASLHRLPPEAWDAIIPHSLRSQFVRSNRLDLVGLNPQPLPPIAGSVLTAVAVAQEVVKAGSIAESIGGGGARLISDEIDDWCGTGWPRHWPFPPPDPRPGPEWKTADLQFAAALVIADSAGRMADGEPRDALAAGAEKLMNVALEG